MNTNSVAKIIRSRSQRELKSSLLFHGRIRHNNTAASFSISSAKSLRCIPSLATQQASRHYNHYPHHSFSTTIDSSESTKVGTSQKDKLPASATTGTIAAHKQPIPTERDIAMAGGVWAVTSAKRDKLGELKNALGEEHDTLDDMATDDELLDLHLADGLKLIAKVTDNGLDATSSSTLQLEDTINHDTNKILNDFSTWLNDHKSGSLQSNEIDETGLGIKLEVIMAKIDNLLEMVPADRCLRNIRDFLDPEDVSEDLKSYTGAKNPLESSNNNTDDLNMDTAQFMDSVTRYRLLLVKSAIDHVLKSWKIFTTVSDADIDRAAAEGIALQPELDTISLNKVVSFLQQAVSGSCSSRFSAAWDLMDRDQDGLLDEEEMHQVVHFCLNCETKALEVLFEEALDAFSVRAPLSAIGNEEHLSAAPKGWRERRATKKVKKRLLKMFQKSCTKHFDVEVEINHRLRCIYAWANKADQDNQMKSILVDEQVGWSGRKRYVELSPKISEAEFREVQAIHFKHLDRLGVEIITSFREDLWVLQGKRRERKELVRNSFLFLAGVSAIDYVILML